jgi:gas vesicle protein
MADSIVNKNTTTALIAGALLGAGVALLFAPQSGRKTRRDIRQFAEKARNKAEAAQLELRHSIDNIVGDIAEKIQDRVNSGMNWTDSKIRELQHALEEGRKFVAEEIDKIQST